MVPMDYTIPQTIEFHRLWKSLDCIKTSSKFDKKSIFDQSFAAELFDKKKEKLD